MNRENFLALGTKTKLVDLAGRPEADTPEHTPTKHPHHGHQRRVSYHDLIKCISSLNKKVLFLQHGQSSGGLLCCCKKAVVNPDEDRVELAFRRIDLNNDGFITWDEFVKVFLFVLFCFNTIFNFSECWRH